MSTDTQINPVSQNNPIRLLSAEYHILNAKVLKMLFQNYPNIKYAGNAFKLSEIILFLDESDVDVLLLDINMPGLDCRQFMSFAKMYYPQMKIIIYSDFDDGFATLEYAVKYGACGYLAKDADLSQIIEAVNTVYSGDYYFNRLMKLKIRSNQEFRFKELVH